MLRQYEWNAGQYETRYDNAGIMGPAKCRLEPRLASYTSSIHYLQGWLTDECHCKLATLTPVPFLSRMG